MTGYTRKWDCLVCEERQDTIDSPRVAVCEKCLTPLAKHLCREEMGERIPFSHPALDRNHFIRKAECMAELLFLRRKIRS